MGIRRSAPACIPKVLGPRSRSEATIHQVFRRSPRTPLPKRTFFRDAAHSGIYCRYDPGINGPMNTRKLASIAAAARCVIVALVPLVALASRSATEAAVRRPVRSLASRVHNRSTDRVNPITANVPCCVEFGREAHTVLKAVETSRPTIPLPLIRFSASVSCSAIRTDSPLHHLCSARAPPLR